MASNRSPSPPTFRVDVSAERLSRDGVPLALRPKTWLVLRLLLDHPGDLVSKELFLDSVWPGTAVGEGVLNKSVAELRTALGDNSRSPRFIETVPKRGFRWIDRGGVVVEGAGAATRADTIAMPDGGGQASTPPTTLVGRDAELRILRKVFAQAASGTRQGVFVTGEAGAGKSTLVEAFLAELGSNVAAPLIAHGQCIEVYGAHEPYRPLLEAVERLAHHEDAGATVLRALRTHAPSWLRQMPSLAEAPELAEADAGLIPSRMLREFAAAMEEVARHRPVVVVLEDAHWADMATIDACNVLARRRDPAHLMILATIRLTDALVSQHPVLAARADLAVRGLATEVLVAPFDQAFVQSYLEARCGGLEQDGEFAQWIHHQTGGNPLFVRIVVDDLIARGVLAQDGGGRWKWQRVLGELREFVPDSLRVLVEAQIGRLSTAERTLVAAASVSRGEFSASALAPLADVSEEEAEEICEGLAKRGQILQYAARAGRPGAQRDGRFEFVHSLVRRILQDNIPVTRLQRLHRAAAEQLEREHSGREDSVAVPLALHYAMAGDPSRALTHLQRAAASVQRIPAPRDVIVIRERILELVEGNPDLPGHRRELVVATMDVAEARQLAFAVVDRETAALCERVLQLAVTAEDGKERFLASMGIFSNRFYTGRYAEAREIGRALLVVAEQVQHPFMIKSAHFAIAGSGYRLGELEEARTHFDACLQHAASSQQTYGWDFQSMSLSHLALVAIHQGKNDEARRLIQDAEESGTRDGGSADAAVVPLVAYAQALLRDNEDAMGTVRRALEKSDQIGAAAWIERARFVHGLLLSRHGQVEEGINLMSASLARQARNNVLIDRSAYGALLAEEMLRCGVGGVQAVLGDAFGHMEQSGERHFEPELLRLRAAMPQ